MGERGKGNEVIRGCRDVEGARIKRRLDPILDDPILDPILNIQMEDMVWQSSY
ncbi:MAG: hypothetical protein SVW57_10865 [Thermodesulfobacteriota bacterium]|nr:hypothetical protein [Thermodesulfobacteriota bacterium]